MSTPRKQIAARIAADHAGIDVYSFPWQPAELRRPAVTVWRDELVQGKGTLEQSISISLYGVRGTPGAASEDELDDLLDDVLISLRRLETVALVKAERKVLADVFQGWEIACTWTSQDYYKTAVLNEG